MAQPTIDAPGTTAGAGTTTRLRRTFTIIPGVSGRQLMAGAIGNLIEWFDWNAYAFLSVYFARLFFPANTPALVSLLGSFGILAVGFLCRPLAGLVLGFLSDRIGRKPTLMLTVYGMGAASLIIALAPTYAQIGLAAPLLLLVSRIIQGFCIGGEYASLSAFAMEMSPTGKRGRVAGYLTAIAAIGQLAVVLLIFGLSSFLSTAEMTTWGWRVVFGIGAAIAFGGVWLRRGMKETLDTHRVRGEHIGIFTALRRHPRQSIMVVGIVLGFTAMVYAWGAYMPAYATTSAGIAPKDTMAAMLISLLVSIAGAIPAGYLSDRYGRKATMIAAGVILSVGTVPAMTFLSPWIWSLVIAQSFGLLVLDLLQASSMPAFAEMFPASFRSTGLGFPYALTVGLIGGTIPMVGTQLTALHLGTFFPWYLVALMVISTLFYIGMKETAFDPLPE
ncbi:MAG TPA: MFS transporter [Microbacteriaceae bacterium]|nr:MFS transporter [Microbacteriaceae bacterium]